MVNYYVQVNRSKISSAEIVKHKPHLLELYKKSKTKISKQKVIPIFQTTNHSVVSNLTHLFEDTNLFKDEKILYKDSDGNYDIDMSKKTAKKLIKNLKKDKEYLASDKIQRVPNQISKLENSLDKKRKKWVSYKKKHGSIKAIKKFGLGIHRQTWKEAVNLEKLKIKLKETKSKNPYSISYKDDCDAVISALESALALKKNTINLRWGID